MGTPQEKPRSKEWLEDWDPQDESKWDSKIAWTTLTITTFSLTMAFASWFLPSAVIPKLTSIGFTFTKDELYWMTSMVGCPQAYCDWCGWCFHRSWGPAS